MSDRARLQTHPRRPGAKVYAIERVRRNEIDHILSLEEADAIAQTKPWYAGAEFVGATLRLALWQAKEPSAP